MVAIVECDTPYSTTFSIFDTVHYFSSIIIYFIFLCYILKVSRITQQQICLRAFCVQISRKIDWRDIRKRLWASMILIHVYYVSENYNRPLTRHVFVYFAILTTIKCTRYRYCVLYSNVHLQLVVLTDIIFRKYQLNVVV